MEILQAVGLAPDYSVVPPPILARASARGTAVHEAIAEHAAGTLWGVEPHIKPYLDAYERFLADTGHEVICGEVELCHPELRFVGHPDRIGWLNNDKRCLLDWKTSERLEIPPVAYQLAGYRILWHREHPTEPIEVSAAVQLRRDGTYRLYDPEQERYRITAAEAERIFLAAVTVYHAVARDRRTP
jgi:hypothetical protein